MSKGMSNIYLKGNVDKKFRKFSFSGAPFQAYITKFSNFLLQLKNQRSGSKTLCGFSIILILKGMTMF